MTTEKEKIYWLAWSKINGLGPISLRKIYDYFGSLENAWLSSSTECLKVDGIGKKIALTISQEKSQIDPEKLYIKHQQTNPYFCTPSQIEYPQLLLEIPSPPAIILSVITSLN